MTLARKLFLATYPAIAAAYVAVVAAYFLHTAPPSALAAGLGLFCFATIVFFMLRRASGIDWRDALVVVYVALASSTFAYTVYVALAVHHTTDTMFVLATAHRIASLVFFGFALVDLIRRPFRVWIKVVIAAVLLLLSIVALPAYYTLFMRREAVQVSSRVA